MDVAGEQVNIAISIIRNLFSLYWFFYFLKNKYLFIFIIINTILCTIIY